jgi:ATP adenylyltransferase
MTYHELRKFILEEMVMHEVYQPIMLIAMLNSKGSCSEEEIAKEIAKAIPADRRKLIKHYKARVRYVMGEVLELHNIVEREGETYRLKCYESLSEDEIKHLVTLCEKKMEEYLQKHG